LTKKTGHVKKPKQFTGQNLREKLNRCLERRGEVIVGARGYFPFQRKGIMLREDLPEDVFDTLAQG